MVIKISPDKELVADIRGQLKENGGYCPCALTRTEETKCMCREFVESTEEGYCHCGLYFKENTDD